jgi:hypothetical protein
LIRTVVGAHVDPGDEPDSLGGHQVQTPLHYRLFQLHVGNSVHQQAAGAISALEDSDTMAGLIKLTGAGQSSRSGSNYCNSLPSPHGGRSGNDPSSFETFVDNGLFDPLDGDGRVVDAQDTRSFARGRATPDR